MSTGKQASFYKSKQWQRTREAFLSCRHFICERCGKPATIAHHKTYLTAENLSDPSISLSFENLEALCQDCHNAEHFGLGSTARGLTFNSNGELCRL